MTPDDPPNTTGLEATLAIQMWMVSAAFERRLGVELAPLGLTVAGFRLVGELFRAPEGLRIGTLAERLGVKAPSVSGMVDRFEAQGLVKRIADPNDARASLVRLTADAPLVHGLEVLARIERDLTVGMGPAERTAFAGLLSRAAVRLTGEPQR